MEETIILLILNIW